MSDKIRRYDGKFVTIRYDARRCIHYAECVKRLPGVFDQNGRPWVNADGDGPQEVMRTIMHCPTGALTFERRDGGDPEPVPTKNVATVSANGPIVLRGDLHVEWRGRDGRARETRAAFCRCGASENKPFCDGRHDTTGFADAGELPNRTAQAPGDGETALTLTAAPNGPLLFQGPLEIRSHNGATHMTLTKGALCRCGHSATKPFCDGAHRVNGFQG